MKQILVMALAAVVAGVSIVSLAVVAVEPEAPSRQEIYITVSNRKELLVRQNQQVRENQVLADTRGTTSRRIAALQLQRQIYQQETFKPLPLVPVPPLGKPSFLREETRVAQAEQQVKAQGEILNALAGEDENILAHETAKLRKLEQERDILRGELESKKYQYSLEVNRAESIKQSQNQDYQRQLAIWQRSEQERRNNLLKLELEIADIKEQETLIRSPYDGTIQKVVWQSQRGNRLDVLLILLPTRAEPRTTPTGNAPGNANGSSAGTKTPMRGEYPGVLAGLTLIGDPRFTGITGTRHSTGRIG